MTTFKVVALDEVYVFETQTTSRELQPKGKNVFPKRFIGFLANQEDKADLDAGAGVDWARRVQSVPAQI